MSLNEPEPVDSVLTFLSGYDTLEYSWVKATAVFVRLRILFVTLQNTNSGAGGVKKFGSLTASRALHLRNDCKSPALAAIYNGGSVGAGVGLTHPYKSFSKLCR